MSLSRNASFSLVSAVLQMAVTIVTIPIYLRVIGLERYGVIVVVWLLFDYMMLFSLGLDKAASNYLAKVRHSHEDTGSVFGTAALFSLIFGVLGGIVMLLALYPVMQSWMGISATLTAEAGSSANWIAILTPLAVIGLVFTSFLQSREHFFELSIAQLLTSVAFQIVPLSMALFFGANLETVLVAGVAARAVMPVAAIVLAFRRGLHHRTIRPSRQWMQTMLGYGLWSTVSGIVSPLVVNLDRFFISSRLGSAAVGLYNVPLNLVMRVQILPTSLQAVLFPRLSAATEEERQSLSVDAVLSLGIILAPALLVGAAIMKPLLDIWIGDNPPAELAQVGEVLLLGIWFNCLAYIPYVTLQARGRPDLIAKFHLIEVLPFIVILWFAIEYFGIVGAAWAWTLRSLIDSLLLFWATGMLRSLVKLLLPLALLGLAVALATTNVLGLAGTMACTLLLLVVNLIWSIRSAPPPLRLLVTRIANPVMRRLRPR